MKVLGIVAEYNPFHNGHKYHLEEAKKLTNSDYTVVVMSGSFTQQGNIAIYDKFTRAKLAIENGADLVIELPTIFACSSAEFFAHAAVNLLDKIGIVDSICFGSEAKDIGNLNQIANIIIDLDKKFWEEINQLNKGGLSFAKSREQVLKKYLNQTLVDVISKPNNILGIEYIKAIKKLGSKIIPYNILRQESDHLDKSICEKKDKSHSMASATSIRNIIKQDEFEEIAILKKFVPKNTFEIIKEMNPVFNDDIFKILRYKIASTTKQDLSKRNEVTEGLENKVIKATILSKNYDELIRNIKSKRYVESKIRRMLINILLGIDKNIFTDAFKNNISYANVLALNENGKTLLSEMSRKSGIPVISKFNEETLMKLDENIQSLVNIDINATNLHSIVEGKEINLDYFKKL